MKNRLIFMIHIFFLIVLLAISVPVLSDDSYRVGVLAKRGHDIAVKEWAPLGQYLSEKSGCCHFEIVPLDFDEIFPAVENKEIDFVLSNPSFYVEMESRYGVSRIATLKNRVNDSVVFNFGGVIFTRADNDSIKTLEDLRGTTFSAVDETSFGGWHAAWRELKDIGIDPHKDFAELVFRGTHDAVVKAILDGDSDAGTVRTDTLEEMVLENSISLDRLRVLNSGHSESLHFPLLLSTRLYPEWPFSKLAHTPDDLAERVSIALIEMDSNSPAAIAAGIEGWTIPRNYQPVHDCLRELKVGPYREYGKIRIEDFIFQYRYLVLFIVVTLVVGTIGILHVVRINRQLVTMQAELRKTGEYLEQGIRERTSELEASKKQLEEDIRVRMEAEEALKMSEKKLRTLSRQLLSIQEKERSRLSRELHDELGQKLAGLFLEIEFLKQKKGVDSEFLANAGEILKKVNDDLDRLYMGLRPVAIDKLGLSYAIEALVREYRERGLFEISCEIEKVGKRDIAADIAIDLYRITQESMNNIAKHSGADKIEITLEWKQELLCLVIKDNGKGFDESEIKEDRGFGLLGMRERVEQHGGKLEILGGPGKGATIIATIEINRVPGESEK